MCRVHVFSHHKIRGRFWFKDYFLLSKKETTLYILAYYIVHIYRRKTMVKVGQLRNNKAFKSYD